MGSVQTYACCQNLHAFLSSVDLFQSQLFIKKSFQNTIRVQSVLILIRPDVLLGLIWVQTDCEDYQQTILAGKGLKLSFV